jgi:hypothetical protein
VTAIPAIAIRTAHPGNSHAGTYQGLRAFACDNFADDLMTGNQSGPKRGEIALDDVQIRSTHATGEDAK